VPSSPTLESTILAEIEKILESTKGSFGLLLDHKYCVDTRDLTGWYSILHAAAKSTALKTNREVHFLPILIKFDAERHLDCDEFTTLQAPVFPLSQAHMDALIADAMQENSHRERRIESEFITRETTIHRNRYDIGSLDYIREEKSKEVKLLKIDQVEPWLFNLKDVPFYSTLFWKTKLTWRNVTDEGIEDHPGAKPETADGIYLAYALVVHTMKTEKRKRDEKDEGRERD